MRFVLASLAAAALMVPLGAFAQERGQDGQRDGQREGQRDGQRGRGFGGGGFGGFQNPVIQALDKNSDGELSSDEINNATAALKALDKNKDGKIDREEQRPDFVGAMIAGLMQRDENKDKKLSKEEAGERMAERFADIDANKDNQIDEAELRKYYSNPENMRFGGGRGFGGDRGRDGDGGRDGGNRRPGGDNNRPARPSGDVEL